MKNFIKTNMTLFIYLANLNNRFIYKIHFIFSSIVVFYNKLKMHTNSLESI
jgi:hypothetical protein